MRTTHFRLVRLAGPLLIVLGFLTGCAAPTSTRTTVVLLPEEDNAVGTVAVASSSSKQRLDKAFSDTSVNGNSATPSNARAFDRDTVKDAYGYLLKTNPLAPRIFVLQFLLDKTELTDESKALIPAMLRAVRARKPASITIFGHADATGAHGSNLKLSADRAEAAADLLRANDLTLKNIDLQYFGDTKPSTGLSASDAKNRRVEILIF